MRRSFGNICWSLDPFGGNLKVIWAHVEVTSRTFGHIWDSFEPSGRSSGDMWGDLGVHDGPREGRVLKTLSFKMFFKGPKRPHDSKAECSDVAALSQIGRGEVAGRSQGGRKEVARRLQEGPISKVARQRPPWRRTISKRGTSRAIRMSQEGMC